MKYLVIAPQPFFSPRGTPFSVYYRTLISAELGAEIDFLTYGQGEDVDIPGVRIMRTPKLGFLGPVRIGPSLLKLVHDFFIFFRFGEVAFANLGKKGIVLLFDAVGGFFSIFGNAIFRRFGGKVQNNGKVGNNAACGNGVELFDGIYGKSSAISLIGNGG